MSPWYQIRAQADVADVEISGPIAPGNGHRFLSALPPSARTIRLAVASLGGDATAALQIAHGLRERRARGVRVEATITRLCASAATMPVCAADRVRIAADAVAMIHAPRAVPNTDAAVTSQRLRSAADDLDRVKSDMATVYGWKLTCGRDAIARLVNDEAGTWYDARESVTLGLADQIGPAVKVAAMFNASDVAALGTIPLRFRGLFSTLTRTATTQAPATRFAAELTPDEKAALEGVRDQLIRARDNLHAVVGDAPESASARMYAKYNAPRILSAVDEEERTRLEAARDDVSAALATVRKLLGEPAPSARFDARSAYARLNAPGPVNVFDIYRNRNEQGATNR